MYDSLGNMAAQISRKDRPRFSSNDRMAGSVEEMKGAFETYVAYFGRYRVDERERSVTHEVQQALFPNWAGSKQVRYYTFAASSRCARRRFNTSAKTSQRFCYGTRFASAFV